MINITEASVRVGEAVATFPITVPRPTGIDSAHQRCLGKLRHISFTGTDIREIPYHLHFWLVQNSRRYSFMIKTDVLDGNKPVKLSKKLGDHLVEASEAFPLQPDLPDLYYNQDDEEDPHFELTLPGRSAFYSASELFFIGLGFFKHEHLRQETREVGGRRGQKKATKRVFGFFNTSTRVALFRGDTMHAGMSLNANVLQVFRDTPLPATMQLQVELLDWGRQVIQLPPGEPRRLPATKQNAVRLLSMQLRRVAVVLGLRENTMDVISGAGDTVHISNRAFVHAGITLQIEFNAEMASAYGLDEGQMLVFPLDQTRTYDLQVRSVKDNPFIGLYPVIMKASGFGHPISFVEGLGHSTVFAYLNDAADKHPILTDGLMFATERTFVTIEFFDRNKQLIVFKDGHKIEILMSFQFL